MLNPPLIHFNKSVQALLTQDRAHLIDLKHQAGVGLTAMTSAPGYIGDSTSEIRRLQTENVCLG